MLKKLVTWWVTRFHGHKPLVPPSSPAEVILARLTSIDDQQHDFATDLKQVKEKTDTLYSMIEEMRDAPAGWSSTRQERRLPR